MSIEKSITYGKEALWTLGAAVCIFSMALTAGQFNEIFAVAGGVFAIRSIYLGCRWYMKRKAEK